jgi:hypothetical protein
VSLSENVRRTLVTSAIMVAIALGVGISVYYVQPHLSGATTNLASEPNSTYALSANGIKLSLAVNATSITAGENIHLQMSISNTLPATNQFQRTGYWSFSEPFYAVPVAVWPACFLPLPLYVIVLRGNYTQEQLPVVDNSTSHGYPCGNGGVVEAVTFQSNSAEANTTVDTGRGPSISVGPYLLEANVTTDGYWDTRQLTEALNPPIISAQNSTSVPSTPFSPGVYTIAVEDIWNQAVVLHVTVRG